MPQAKLLELLASVGSNKIGMDCSIVPTKYPDLVTISTTDFFYPLIDDPYLMGKIGCANVLSDLYSMGVPDCDNMLMILAASTDMEEEPRYHCTQLMIQGFNDLAKEAGTEVTGGQTVLNPWPIIGGTCFSVQKIGTFIRPENAVAGDVIVLTKALGTQIAVNCNQWLNKQNNLWDRVKHLLNEEDVKYVYDKASKSMARLNKTGAQLMMKYGAHAATDVTGFGILGHASNLAQNQKASVSFTLHTLPVLRKMVAIDKEVKFFKLCEGFSAETSGGLMVCLAAEVAEAFCKEIEEIDGEPAWIIGTVNEAQGDKANTAEIKDNPTFIEV